MLITAEEYKSMGFPEADSDDLSGCLLRADYIIGALTEGRAAEAVRSGGKPCELVKQAAGFQTYVLLREMEEVSRSSQSGSEKVSIGDYSYSTQRSESAEVYTADCDSSSMNVIRLLRASGCMFVGVEVLE